jgi:hypothetical protein
MGAITAEERERVMAGSPVGRIYDATVNRESAHEQLALRVEAQPRVPAPAPQSPGPPPLPPQPAPSGDRLSELLWGTGRRQGAVEAMAKQAARSVGSQIGRQIMRGVLGGILGGSRRR